jgi:PPOX class probable F420-dependent enzyme
VKVEELPQAAIDLIESPGVHAHFVTINADGSPQASIVWSAVEDGEICVASLTHRKKLENIRRDPRVLISYLSPNRDESDRLHQYLVVKGRARITEGGGPAFLDSIKHRFVPPGVKFPRTDDPPEGWMIRVKADVLLGYGPWIEKA